MLLKIPTTKFNILSIGGHQKANFCFVHKDSAFISNDTYDLTTHQGIKDLTAELSTQPQPDIICSDLHPDIRSTIIASEISAHLRCPHFKIQHHIGHICSVLGEYDYNQPVLGIALDGFGLGDDGELWGGEIIQVSPNSYQRLGRLKPIRLAGGDKGTTEPWRTASAFLYDHNIILPNLPKLFLTSLEKQINTPFTSSCGRLFDIGLFLSGFNNFKDFEKSAEAPFGQKNLFHISYNRQKQLWETDLSPLLLKIYYDQRRASDYFHGTLALALYELLEIAKAHTYTNINTIVLSGGCFLNQVLKNEIEELLSFHHYQVLTPKIISSGDSAISFGFAINTIHKMQQKH